MNKTAADALDKIWRVSRFTSYFYQGADFIENKSIPTLAVAVCSSRIAVHFNPGFVNKTGRDHFIGLLVHEMLHVILSHRHRGALSDDEISRNIAQDMVVNSYISSNAKTFFSSTDGYILEIPPGLPRVPQKFFTETGISDPSWEDVYRWMKSREPDKTVSASVDGIELTDQSPPQSSSGSCSSDADHSSDSSIQGEPGLQALTMKDESGEPMPTGMHVFTGDSDSIKIEAAKDRIIEFASRDESANSERVFGLVRGIITRTREVDSSSWKKYLKSIADYASQSSEWIYTHSRFNRRYSAQGLYAAGRMFKEQEIITVAIDLSASVLSDKTDIEKAFGAVESLLGKYKVHLVCLDEQVFIPKKEKGAFTMEYPGSSTCSYRKGDWKYIKTGSGGATFFAPLFNEYMKKHRELLIVITDGEIFDLPALHRYTPTLWLITSGGKNFTPPFGRSVRMDD